MSGDMDPDMQNLVNQVAEQCLVQLRQERAQTEQNQLEQINSLLEHWSEQSFQKTKDLVNSMTSRGQNQASNGPSNSAFADTTADMRDRQATLLVVRSPGAAPIIR
jgi:ferritin-like metal-binding protein YciE